MSDPLPIILHASGPETVSGSGLLAVDIDSRRRAARLTLDVTAIVGVSARITVQVETSLTGVGWRAVGAFTATGALGTQELSFAPLLRFVRVSWTFTGTSVTFSVSGYAHVIYCTPSDLTRYGIQAQALASMPQDVLADACLDASEYADSKLRRRYTMPIISWSEDVTAHCARIAVENALTARGFSPNGPDEILITKADQARKELESIGAGKSTPNIVDSTPAKRGSAPRVTSRSTSSGWEDSTSASRESDFWFGNKW